MISYLVDAVLLVALGFTSIRVTKMHRELARLRAYQGEFSSVVNQTTGAFDTVVSAAHDFAAHFGQLANAMNVKIEQAQQMIAEIDARRSSLSSNESNGSAREKALQIGTPLADISR